jgi:hypothetical protein
MINYPEHRAVVLVPKALWKAVKVRANRKGRTARLAVIEALYDWLGTPQKDRQGIQAMKTPRSAGGVARAARLSPARRSEIARAAAIASHKTRRQRWHEQTGIKPFREDEF